MIFDRKCPAISLKKILVLCALLILFAAETVASDQPLLAAYERNPWLMAIGSDSPYFVYYPNGEIIFWQEIDKGRGEYSSLNITNTPQETALLELVEKIEERDKTVILTEMTDQKTYEFQVNTESRSFKVHIYGEMDEEKRQSDRAQIQKMLEEVCSADASYEFCGRLKDGEGSFPKPPQDIAAIWEFLNDQEWSGASPWHYEYLEVLVWPYSHAPDPSILWPEAWPDLTDPSTWHRKNGFSIFLPTIFEDDFYEFLKTRNPRGAVLINDTKMTVSFRIPFPHDSNYPTQIFASPNSGQNEEE